MLRGKTILTRLSIVIPYIHSINLGLGVVASMAFLYLSTIFYRVYLENRNLNTMLLSVSFMLLFLSEVFISLTVFFPLIYGGYIARVLSFAFLLYFAIRLGK